LKIEKKMEKKKMKTDWTRVRPALRLSVNFERKPLDQETLYVIVAYIVYSYGFCPLTTRRRKIPFEIRTHITTCT